MIECAKHDRDMDDIPIPHYYLEVLITLAASFLTSNKYAQIFSRVGCRKFEVSVDT